MNENEVLQLKLLLTGSVKDAYEEPNLLKQVDGCPIRGNEQTVAFRVGIHLHEKLQSTGFSNLNLDCEYNKHLNLPKDFEANKTMRIDLLIHKRFSDESNKLAVEFAGWRKSKKNIEKDIKKLKTLTSNLNSYKYLLGALVIFERGKFSISFFQDGKQKFDEIIR